MNSRRQAISEARRRVELEHDEDRKWLVGKAPDCYNNPDYQTEIHVLEGTPARGYVIDLGAYGHGIVVAMDWHGDILKKYGYCETPPTRQ